MNNEYETRNLNNEEVDTSSKRSGVDYKSSKDFMKIIGLTVSGLFLVLSVILIASSFTPAKEMTETLMAYSTSNNANYRINLVENDFYENSFAGTGDLLPSSFVKNIEIDFASVLSPSQTVSMNYSYDIVAEIVARAAEANSNDEGQSSSASVWTKQYVLKENVSGTSPNGYSLLDTVTVDYNFYNDYLNKYKLFAAIPVDATLNVTMRIKSSGVFNGSNLEENNNVTVSIPLSTSTLRVSTAGTGDSPKALTNTSTVEGENNYVLLVIGIVIFAVSGFVTFKLLVGLRKMTEDHSLIIKLNKITRDYDQIVIEVESLPDMTGMSEVRVSGFKDMIDIQKELHVPILYSKSEILEENTFYIINQNQAYKYVLSGEVEKI